MNESYEWSTFLFLAITVLGFINQNGLIIKESTKKDHLSDKDVWYPNV